MTSKQLPEKASLEHLRKQAKSLLKSVRAKTPDAIQRFQQLPALSGRTIDEQTIMDLALHDAQSVIAREYGFKSWNEMREQVEERTLSLDAAVDEFVRCATGNAPNRALKLLKLYPDITNANLYTELVLGDTEAVFARLQKSPDLANHAGGIRNWEPLLYVCHTCLHRDKPERLDGIVAITRRLLELGANPDAEYDWNWHEELPRTVLWSALCIIRHLPLAEALLEAGANPTDGVSLHIAVAGAILPALELLHRYNVDVNGIPGGVPPLRYNLSWTSNPATRLTGIRWLLEHGADANLAWNETGDAPLHIAAQLWDVAMVELLVQFGADINQRNADGRTAHTLAAIHGNRDIAAWLLEHGAGNELSSLEQFISACTCGERERAEAILLKHPYLRGELADEHHLILQVHAERGDTAVLETMLACGFDVNAKDRDGVTALHRAAMSGKVDAVRLLLEYGASVNALDGMFSANPLVWAVQGWEHSGQQNQDYIDVARLLLEAGSTHEWLAPDKAPHLEGTQEQLLSFCRAVLVEADNDRTGELP